MTWFIRDSKALREIYTSPHAGTITLNVKNANTQFAAYKISQADARKWANDRRVLLDQFMLGINWANIDNKANFVCTWNGVTVVNGVYARPAITGAPAFQAGQNRIFDFQNEMRIQNLSGNLAGPRNHASWSTNYGGYINYGSAEEYLYGQTNVDISEGINVVWSYWLEGTGTPFIFYDNLRVVL